MLSQHSYLMNRPAPGKFRPRFLSVALALASLLILAKTAMALPLVISPSSGAPVSGAVKITVAASAPVSWFNLNVDGTWIASNPGTTAPSYNFTWDSSRVARGNHAISVIGYNNSNQQVATAAATIKVLPLTYYVAS